MRPFVPYTNDSGDAQTTQVITLSTSTNSAIIPMPDGADQLRVNFGGASLAVQFVPRALGTAPPIDLTKCVTRNSSGVEILSIPNAAGTNASVVVSGSGSVDLTPGNGFS